MWDFHSPTYFRLAGLSLLTKNIVDLNHTSLELFSFNSRRVEWICTKFLLLKIDSSSINTLFSSNGHKIEFLDSFVNIDRF